MDGTLKDLQQISRTSSKVLKYAVYWGFVPLIVVLAAYDFYQNAGSSFARPPTE